MMYVLLLRGTWSFRGTLNNPPRKILKAPKKTLHGGRHRPGSFRPPTGHANKRYNHIISSKTDTDLSTESEQCFALRRLCGRKELIQNTGTAVVTLPRCDVLDGHDELLQMRTQSIQPQLRAPATRLIAHTCSHIALWI